MNIFVSYGGKLEIFDIFDDDDILIEELRCLTTSNSIHGLQPSDVFITCNGRLMQDSDVVQHGGVYHVVPRLVGGKGGFGSMLRAIGAQIEKTTSREACRDLSGRRMRDVNNEKKLKDWMGKQGERAQEKEQQRKDRLERRKRVPNHKFNDPKYSEQKAAVAENLEDALSQGLNKASSSSSGKAEASSTVTLTSEARKRRLPDESPVDKKKAAEWLGMDIDNLSDLESDSDDSSSESQSNPSTSAGPSSNGSSGNAAENMEVEPCVKNNEIELENDRLSSLNGDHTTNEESNSSEQKPKHGLLAALSPPKSEKCQPDSYNEDENSAVVDLDDFASASELETVGADRLKLALTVRGLKCGGTLEERAKRLFSVKGLAKEEIDLSLFAKPVKGKSSKGKK